MTEPPASPTEPLILVVDDEPLVLDVLDGILSRAGFRVLRARDGLEALELFEARSGEVAAAIIDRSMPRMDGPALLAELRRRRPELPAILSTGFGATRLDGPDLAGPAPLALPKPYRVSVLIETLRRALAG